MRIYAAALLITLAFAASAVTVSTGAPTANTSLYDSGTNEYITSYFRFNLPAIPSGATITGATLFVRCSSTSGAGAKSLVPDDTMGAHVQTGADTSWTNASSFATINGIGYGMELDTEIVTTPGVIYSWNILGAALTGITKEYADSQTTTNVILFLTSTGSQNTKAGASVVRMGDDGGDSADFYDMSGSDVPYISITYTGGVVVPMSPDPGGVIQINRRGSSNENMVIGALAGGVCDRWYFRGRSERAAGKLLDGIRGYDAYLCSGAGQRNAALDARTFVR